MDELDAQTRRHARQGLRPDGIDAIGVVGLVLGPIDVGVGGGVEHDVGLRLGDGARGRDRIAHITLRAAPRLHLEATTRVGRQERHQSLAERPVGPQHQRLHDDGGRPARAERTSSSSARTIICTSSLKRTLGCQPRIRCARAALPCR